MMAAISASKSGHNVRLLEKNNRLGNKLYITGKGRCNFTNACDIDEFMENIVTNRRFMYSSLSAFSPWDMMRFLARYGLRARIERGRRVFPVSDHASDVTKALKKAMKENGVEVLLHTKVTDITLSETRTASSPRRFRVYAVNALGKEIYCDADSCIVATGGLSYPETGSDGDGYRFATKFGICVNKCRPSLGPLYTKEDVSMLEGVSLRNVSISIYSADNGKRLFEDGPGEILFTRNGMSGPLILSASAFLSKELSEGKTYNLFLDLKPGLRAEKLDKRLIQDLDEGGKKSLENALRKLLISPLRELVIERAGVDPKKKAALIAANERKLLKQNIKKLKFTILRIGGFEESIITQGGVDVLELDPKTMESRKIPGLFFVGEILDVDALTGGYNLQIAWSSGDSAGRSV